MPFVPRAQRRNAWIWDGALLCLTALQHHLVCGSERWRVGWEAPVGSLAFATTQHRTLLFGCWKIRFTD
jgi:hypothetical protein